MKHNILVLSLISQFFFLFCSARFMEKLMKCWNILKHKPHRIIIIRSRTYRIQCNFNMKNSYSLNPFCHFLKFILNDIIFEYSASDFWSPVYNTRKTLKIIYMQQVYMYIIFRYNTANIIHIYFDHIII